MTASNRAGCIERVLAHEGGYSNNPSDPGGPTNFGITLADARAYWKPKATATDVRAMPKSVAVDIYRARYWETQRCDELPSGVDYSVFDYGVNSGIGRAKKVLQRVVGVTDDGDLGPLTMQAIAARDAADIVAAINDERLAFLKSLKTWPVFGRGWASRVADVRRDSLALGRERDAIRRSCVACNAGRPRGWQRWDREGCLAAAACNARGVERWKCRCCDRWSCRIAYCDHGASMERRGAHCRHPRRRHRRGVPYRAPP